MNIADVGLSQLVLDKTGRQFAACVFFILFLTHEYTGINCLNHGRRGSNFKNVISEHMIPIKFRYASQVALRWMLQDLTYD